jgi:hypothetical protein
MQATKISQVSLVMDHDEAVNLSRVLSRVLSVLDVASGTYRELVNDGSIDTLAALKAALVTVL